MDCSFLRLIPYTDSIVIEVEILLLELLLLELELVMEELLLLLKLSLNYKALRWQCTCAGLELAELKLLDKLIKLPELIKFCDGNALILMLKLGELELPLTFDSSATVACSDREVPKRTQ